MESSIQTRSDRSSYQIDQKYQDELKCLRRREAQYQKELEQRKQKEEALRRSIKEKDKLIQQLQVYLCFHYFMRFLFKFNPRMKMTS